MVGGVEDGLVERFVPAQIAPGAGALGTEDPIQLLQRQSGQGISAVEIDADRRVPAGYIVAAGHGDDPERQIAELPLERQLLVPHDLAPHRSDIGHPEDQSGHGVLTGLQVKIELHLRLILLEVLLPILRQRAVAEVVRAPHPDGPRYLLLG